MRITDYCYDTEFLERGPDAPIMFISIGIVRVSDGAKYYAVSNEFDVAAVRGHEEFLKDNVWPLLPRTVSDELNVDHEVVKSRAQIAAEVHQFLTAAGEPRLWAWYAGYDHVAYAQLFGTMATMPEDLPRNTNDLVTKWEDLGKPELPEQETYKHHALYDAQHDVDILQFMRALEAERTQTASGLSVPSSATS